MAKNIQPTPEAQKQEDERLAQDLENNPLLQRAFTEIEEMYTNEWKRTEGPHDDMRERAYWMVRSIERLRSHISEYMVTGKLNKQRVKDTLDSK